MISEDISKKLFSFFSLETKKIQLRKKSLYKSVLELQQKILISHRLICLLPYYMFVIESKKQHKEQQTFMPIMNDSDMISLLINPNKVSTFSDHMMMIQESSFVLNYLETNSFDLAREVVNSKITMNNLDYYHLMFQIIPSIFGYFHSQQHLNGATLFYQSIIDIISDTEKTAIRVLQPFLNSPATFRYIEYVMSKVFKKIILCDAFNKFINAFSDDKKSNSYKEYVLIRNQITKKFFHCLIKGVSLLPEQILQIFRRIRTKHNDKWTQKNWYKLVFSIFIGPHFARWSRSHFFYKDKKKETTSNHANLASFMKNHCSSAPKKGKVFHSRSISMCNQPTKVLKNDFISDILANFLNDIFKRDFDLFIESLCTAESAYCIPDMYKCFEKCSIQHFLAVKDVIILVNFMKERNILPPFIRERYFQGVPDDVMNSVFFVNVYQNDEPLKKRIEKSIVFPCFPVDPEIAQKFEEQNYYRSRLASLESLAYMRDKDRLSFALEESKKDPAFHQYVKTHIAIQCGNTAESFEEYIELCRIVKEIEKWDVLQSSNLDIIFLAYLNNLRDFHVNFDLLPKKVQLVNQLKCINEAEFDNQFSQLVGSTCKLDEYLNDLISKNIKSQSSSILRTNEIYENQNPKILKYLKVFNGMNDYYVELPLYFFKALKLFSMIPLVTFPEKYDIFMNFQSVINNVFPKDDETLLLILFKQISAYVLLKIFFKISILVIHNENCIRCMPREDIARFQQFENVIYQTMTADNEMLKYVLNCQIYLQNFFAKNNASFKLVGMKKFKFDVNHDE